MIEVEGARSRKINWSVLGKIGQWFASRVKSDVLEDHIIYFKITSKPLTVRFGPSVASTVHFDPRPSNFTRIVQDTANAKPLIVTNSVLLALHTVNLFRSIRFI